MHPLFMNKANRDEYVKSLRLAGAFVRKTSIRNQLIHPMYVADYTKETGIELSQADCGFGNTIYNTHFAVLYSCESR